MKKGKEKLKIVIAFFVGVLVTSSVVCAATLYSATEVSYDNSSSGTSNTNVQTALDELYDLSGKALPISVSSSAPTYTGKEGELVILSNQEATKYYVSSNEPINPEANSIWIVEGNSGSYSVSSSNVSFPIVTAKQYIDSAWVETPCFIYQNSKWNIIDRIGPILTVEGHTSDYSVTIVQNSSYTIPTGTATDNLTSNVSVTRSGSVTPSTVGTYKVTYTAKDEAGNTATLTLTVNVIASTYTYNYTGGVQTFTVPATGTYQLEVWGSKGNQASSSGYGGYSMGYKYLEQGTTLYVVCGGIPYNGGGGGGGANSYGNHHGGGATHIALVTGTLASIGKDTFDQQGLIVAGGGGGHGYGNEGSGGGLEGGSTSRASGGTQTSGYSFGQGGAGGFASYWGCGGGGGGYYGGYGGTGNNNNTGYSGAGGSGWIGGVTSYNGDGPSTSNGVNGDTGKAKITFVG